MSDEKKEKKEQLRSKVQALVTYYEEEKRRNEELEMEIERLRAEQQRASEYNQPAAMPPVAPSFAAMQQQPSYQMQHFAPPPPAPAPQPAAYRYTPPAAPTPAYPAAQQGAASCQRVVQCAEQLRARLQQAAYDYTSPYGDYETLGLMDRLQEQLSELCRELGVPAPAAPAPAPQPQPVYAPPPPASPAPAAPAMHYPPSPPRYY